MYTRTVFISGCLYRYIYTAVAQVIQQVRLRRANKHDGQHFHDILLYRSENIRLQSK